MAKLVIGPDPPAHLRFLALRSMSANLKMRLSPAPQAIILPVDYFLTDAQGRISQGQLWKKDIQILPISLPKGISYLTLSVRPKDAGPKIEPSFPIVAELEAIKLSDLVDFDSE